MAQTKAESLYNVRTIANNMTRQRATVCILRTCQSQLELKLEVCVPVSQPFNRAYCVDQRLGEKGQTECRRQYCVGVVHIRE